MRSHPVEPLAEKVCLPQVVGWHGVGYSMPLGADVAALEARGIPLMLPGAANSTAVAEQTLALMLAVARKVLLGFERIVALYCRSSTL